MGGIAFAPLESETVAAQVQRRLEEAIYSGQLKPGQRLIEADLAEALQVSRASFREALRLLQSKGLVVNTHRRGTFVAELSANDVRDLYNLRLVLEVFAIRHAAEHRDDLLLNRLQELVGDLHQRAVRRDHLGIVDLDLEIHRAICAATGNRKLLEMWGDLVAPSRALLLTKYRLFDDSPDITLGHQRLVDAIRDRDSDRAEALLRSHIVDTWEEVLHALATEKATAGSTGGDDGGQG